MITASATVGRPTRGFDARTRNWYFRVAGAEGLRHMHYLNQLMMRGRAGTGWLNVPGELLMLGMPDRARALEGWKDFYRAAWATEHATINYYPLQGVRAAEGAIDAYIDLEVLAASWPGVELDHQSIAILVTSNRQGAYNDAGATGTGGFFPLMIRASSGFRGGVWLCASQVQSGNAVAAGWQMGSRVDHNTGFARSNDVETLVAIPAISLPNQTLNLLSAEPSSGNSPNQLLMFWLGGTLTAEQAIQQEDDAMTYVRDIGTWDGVDTSTPELGPNCYGPQAINQIIPADLRIMRQRPVPIDDAVPGSAYIGYPMTGVWSRFFLAGVRTGPNRKTLLGNNPITTTLGSPTLTIAYTAHGLPVGHAVTLTGALAGNGLISSNLNRAYEIASVPNANSFTVTSNASATAAGAVGGAGVSATHVTINPIAATLGSPLLTISHTAHDLLPARDMVELSGVVPAAGLADGDLNRRFVVESTPTADSFTVRTGTNAGSGVAAFGGTAVRASYRTNRNDLTTFSFPRNGTYDCFVWSCRGNRDAPGDPITGPTRPNSTEGTPITRRTAGPGGSPPAGINCRPGYELKREGAGATVVQFMWVADCLARNDLRITELWDGDVRPTGWGYLDVAEKYGLDPLKVIPMNEAWVRADELFLEPVQGFATSYGWTFLQNGQMHNVPNVPLAKKAIVIDLEHADKRDPDLNEEMLFDCNQVAAALGFTWSWGGHYITEPHASNNGWTVGNLRRVQEYSNFRGHNLIAVKRADPAAMVASLQAQADRCRGESESLPILYNKFVLSLTLGVGQQAVPLDQCTAVGEWARARGIKEVHIRRAGQREGGVETHFWNQQTEAYLPNLTSALPPPPEDAKAALDAWVTAVVSAGDPLPSVARQGLILDLLSPLFAAGIFNELESFTLFANDTSIRARMDLRRLTMGSLAGTAALVPDRWLLIDGAAGGYYDHGWAPSQSVVMTAADQMLAVFCKDEAGIGSVYAAGALNNAATGQALRINPDGAATTPFIQVVGQTGFEQSSNPATEILEPSPGTGLFWIQKRSGQKQGGRNGLALFSGSMTTDSALLPTVNMITGGYNQNSGIPGFPKAGQRLATIVGKSQSAADMQVLSDALAVYFTAIGALP